MGTGAWFDKEEIEDIIEAIYWCGGSDDFSPGGKAEIGWNITVRPLLALLKEKLNLSIPL